MSFRVLEIGDVGWNRAIAALPADRRDIHLDQRMLAPYVATYGWRAGLAITDGGSLPDQYVIQPFLITDDGEFRHAYNFGGPVAFSLPINAREHFSNLDDYAKSHGVVRQYCTLSPFLARHQLGVLASRGLFCGEYDVKYVKDVVWMDLNCKKIRGTTRRAATKAQNAGVTVKSYDYTHLGTFYEMYQATMERTNAAQHWRMHFKFFEAFVRFLKPELLLAYYEGKAQAGCLMVCGAPLYQTAYYHFAGSYNTVPPSLGVGQLLVLSAAERAKALGCNKLHLGGGVTDTSDDGLFIFKSGFSKLRAPVYTYEVDYASKKNKEKAA